MALSANSVVEVRTATGAGPMIAARVFVGCCLVASAAFAQGSDDFDRALLNPWKVYSGNVGLVVGDLAVLSVPGGGVLVAHTTVPATADQFSEAVYSDAFDSRVALQVFVRRRLSDSQRYGCHYNPRSGVVRWEIKLDGGVGAPVIGTGLFPPPLPGDTIRIEAEGAEIRCLHNGTILVVATNSVLPATGEVGMTFSTLGLSGLTYPLRYAASWAGGSLP